MKKVLIVFLVIAALLVVGASSAGTRMINGISDMIIASRDDGIEEISKIESKDLYSLMSVEDFSIGIYSNDKEYSSTAFTLGEGLAIADYSYIVVRYDFTALAGHTLPYLKFDLYLGNSAEYGVSNYYLQDSNYSNFYIHGSEWYDSTTSTGGNTYGYYFNNTSMLTSNEAPDTVTFVYRVTGDYIDTFNIYVDNRLLNTNINDAVFSGGEKTHLYGLVNMVSLATNYQVMFDGVELLAFDKDYEGDISSLFDSDDLYYIVTDLSSIEDYSIINGQ